LVYFAEYFINQGLFELLYFKDAFIKNHKDQYRWYNVVYQLAVFISRSSIAFLQIKFLPIFPILQLINVGIVLSIIFYGYVKSIWIVFLIIFWEGLLGGGLFVLNNFNQKIYLIFIYRMLCKRF
jgi:battenin